MLVVSGSSLVPVAVKGGVVAIGNFDGVHRGHRALIATAVGIAKDLGAPAGAIVFEPHPRVFFRPQEPHFVLTPLPMKTALLAELGLKFTIVLTFDELLASLPADRFIADILVRDLSVRHVVVGHDFLFGRGRDGSAESLSAAGAQLGFKVTILAPVAEDGEVFSSSSVRLHLAQSDIKGAASVLGYLWRVRGTVVGGAKRGTGLGYPTANVPLPKGTALGHGIYAVRVRLAGQSFDGAAYLGTRPTFDNGMPVLEVFLFDFDGDIYGREIEVEFVDFIRPDRKFDNAADLIEQMERDCGEARRILAPPP